MGLCLDESGFDCKLPLSKFSWFTVGCLMILSPKSKQLNFTKNK